MLVLRYFLVFPLLLQCGCVAETQRNSAKFAEKRCAARGEQFVQTQKISEGGITGYAGVIGECVGSDDPRYIKK